VRQGGGTRRGGDGEVRGDQGHRIGQLRGGQAGPGRQDQGALRRQVHREGDEGLALTSYPQPLSQLVSFSRVKTLGARSVGLMRILAGGFWSDSFIIYAPLIGFCLGSSSWCIKRRFLYFDLYWSVLFT
jgi:hypothetical protein